MLIDNQRILSQNPLVQHVKHFLKIYLRGPHPLLLGYSGGTDSLVLLELLKICSGCTPINIQLAHIDHKWRKESSEQAQKLAEQAHIWGIPFHLHTCRNAQMSEEQARKERFSFFSAVYKKIQAQALILAHHANDQAETVLKRILEGAGLQALGAMQPVSSFENMQVWRPLLDVPKASLKEWLHVLGCEPIDDPTNRDRKYLRARMREVIFPQLQTEFGKDIVSPLIKLGKLSHDLVNYFNKKTEKLFSSLISGPFGVWWDLNPFFPLEELEVKFVLKKFFKENKLEISSDTLADLLGHLMKNSANKKFLFKNKTLFVSHRSLFLVDANFALFENKRSLSSSSFCEFGRDWSITISKEEQNFNKTDWKTTWTSGKISLILPESKYHLILPTQLSKPENALLKKNWVTNRVPAFIRQKFPVICREGLLITDLLTGKDVTKNCKLTFFVTIQIKIRD